MSRARPEPILLDDRGEPSLRKVLGRLLARALDACFAISRVRLAGIDLTAHELASVRRCRVLLGRLDADTFAEAAEAAVGDPARLRSLATLLRFASSGRLEVRAAGREAWAPDFSVLRGRFGPGGADGAGAPTAVTLVGAHYFARPHPVGGPALTTLLTDPRSATAALRRFEELWDRSYDVLPVVRETLDRLVGEPGGAYHRVVTSAGASDTDAVRASDRGSDPVLADDPVAVPDERARAAWPPAAVGAAPSPDRARDPLGAAAPDATSDPASRPPIVRPAPASDLSPDPAADDPGGHRYAMPPRAEPRTVRERLVEWTPATPRDAALALLASRFGPPRAADPPGDEPRAFDLAEFQKDAVRRAEAMIAVRRGAILADSVGLGKTYVALGLIDRALRRGARVAVVTPASLRRDWVPRLRRLARACHVRRCWGLGSFHPGPDLAEVPAPVGAATAGSAESATAVPWGGSAAWLTDPSGGAAPDRPAGTLPAPGGDRPFLAWVSHTRLGRGTHSPHQLGSLDLVVVDEAHAFRSPGTRRYRALAELCRGAAVLLLTATPVNNSLMDLYFQLRLFCGDGDFRDVGVPDLGQAFHAAAAAMESPGGPVPPSLMPILRAVMIRRSRPFIRDRFQGVRLPGASGRILSFPRRATPIPVRYALDAADPGLLDEIAETLDALTVAPYRLGEYGDAESGRRGAGAAELLQLMLLKRLESGLPAFHASIARLCRFYESFLSALDRGQLLDAADHRALYGGGDGDVAQLVFDELALRPVGPTVDVARLAEDTRRDLDRLRALRRRVADAASSDPKLAALRALLENELAGRKVLLFTEFRDTARALWRALSPRGGVALIDGAGAFMGRTPCGRREIVERFAPLANGVEEPPARERIDLLIATDVLAEGLNLQDADTVISYDLPWNPVRLIQRVGRVDRIGSRHDVVYPYHFLPEAGLERLLGLLALLRAKLAAIGRSVGTEAAVLDPAGEEHRTLLDRLAAGDPDVLDELERREAAPFEAEERLRAAYALAAGAAIVHRAAGPTDRAANERPGASAEPVAVTGRDAPRTQPSRGVPVGVLDAAGGLRPAVLVGYTVGPEAVWVVVDENGQIASDGETRAAEILVAALERPAPGGTPSPPNTAATTACVQSANILRAIAVAGRHVWARVAHRDPRTVGGLSPYAPGARAARRLMAELSRIPGGPDPALCARADAVLQWLARPHDAGTEAAIADALRAAAPGPGDPTSEAPAPVDDPPLLAALERIRGDHPTSPPPASEPILIGILEVRPIDQKPAPAPDAPAADPATGAEAPTS